MKKGLAVIVVIGLMVMGCAYPGRYNTQKGAAIGGGLGAITGQIIGRNTESTLIGAGVGTLLGSIFGNYEDQRAAALREASLVQQGAYVQPQQPLSYAQPAPQVTYGSPQPQVRTDPPGEWVTVPGYWDGNRWVPAHQEWRPLQP